MSDDITIRDMREGAQTPFASTPPESPAIPLPVADVQPSEYTCEQCGRVFDTVNALNGHLKSHRVKKVPCPECGHLYVQGIGLAVHRKAKHGVESNGSASKRPSKVCPECGKSVRSDNMPRHMRDSHGQSAQPKQRVPHRNEWEVDDIFNTVVSLMWPTGTVPVNAFLPLIHWREATAKMLVEVNG